MPQSYKLSNYSFYFLALLISCVVIFYPPNNTFSYDVFGYYMYLPLLFKYHDITIQNYSTITEILNTYHASETFYQAVKWDNGNWVMRYPIGLSVMFAPFYFISDIITSFTKYPQDGFSKPYQLGILYGCLFYTVLGLYLLKKILTSFLGDKTSAVTLICIVLGTNYFFHVSLHGQGAMSHNIVFTLYALVVYYTVKWHTSFRTKHIVALGLFIGLTALCRASEIICVLIPLFYGVTTRISLKAKINMLFKYKLQILFFLLTVFLVGFIQFAYWKYASGSFIINPYAAGNPGEGLDLLNPHILKVLFSFRKGWFIYTPIMIFTMIGMWILYKKNRPVFFSIFIYFIVNFYIVSSWSCWWYGACFGVRGLIPSYVALCVPLGYFIEYALTQKIRIIYMVLFGLCIGLNLFQSWQMTKGIMDSTNMSRAYYISTFLQTSIPTEDQKKLLLKGKFSDGVEVYAKEDSLTHSLCFAKMLTFEQKSKKDADKYLSNSIKHSGNFSVITNNDNPYSSVIEVMHRNITKKSYCWVKSTVWLYSKYPADSLNAALVIELKHKGYTFKYKDFHLNSSNFKPDTWNKLEYYYLTPDDLRSTKDLVRTFFWNMGKHDIYVDDLTMSAYEPIIDKSVF